MIKCYGWVRVRVRVRVKVRGNVRIAVVGKAVVGIAVVGIRVVGIAVCTRHTVTARWLLFSNFFCYFGVTSICKSG